MNLKSKGVLVTIALLAVIGAGAAAYAAYTIYSSVVGVTLNYDVAITGISYSGSTISVTVNVWDYNKGIAVPGAYVYLWEANNVGMSGETKYGSYGPTDGSGNIVITYTGTANAAYYFQAEYDVP